VQPQRALIYHHRTRGHGVEGTHISGIVNSFRSRGWVVHIVSPPGVTLEGVSAVAYDPAPSRLWGIISDYSPQILFELLEVAYSLYCLYRLNKVIAGCAPEFIYERYSLFNWAGTFIARKHNIPMVLEVNDATVITRSRQLSARWLAKRIERWTFLNATYLVTVSERFRQLISEGHQIPASHVRILHNAVDAKRFHLMPGAVNERKDDKPFILGMVGAFVAWHGVEFLIEAVRDFLKATNSKLLFVGDGPDRAVIERQIDEFQLQNHIEITGFVPSSKVPLFLEQMDVCIMANSNDHGSPVKIFEYMAAGKPVLAPAYGPISAIITHRINGWLFEPLNSASLLEGLETLYRNSDLRAQMGAAARVQIMHTHTWDHRVREIESWFGSKDAMSSAAGAQI
jgi:glycosyltransferase involved in cell wall biosynthesis